MKIIISETQYKKVFDNDFLIVSEQVDGISGAAISTPKVGKWMDSK